MDATLTPPMTSERPTQAASSPEIGVGAAVEHPQYGRGQLAAVYRNGAEWLVRFESGLRFRRPRREFIGQQGSSMMRPSWTASRPEVEARAPVPRTQFEARQVIEALRVGIAPAQLIREFTIGLAAERDRFGEGLTQSHQTGGAAFAVVGDYGFGKSHLVELVSQEALGRGFLVAAISLDLQELPAHRAFDIYAGLMSNLRGPDSDERGLPAFLEKAAAQPMLAARLADLAPVAHDPLTVTLAALDAVSSTRQRAAWTGWLMGQRRIQAMNRGLPRDVKFPSIYRTGHNARQMTYLLSGISVMARLAGYSGLCLLLDEAESYSLLSRGQRSRADLFFAALIAATQGEQQNRVRPETLPQHRWHDYPLTYGDRQSLFFLFTVTRSDNQFPLDEWLDPEQVLELEPHHTAQEIGQFLQQVMVYHGQAYGYAPGERHSQVRRGAAEHLAQGLRNDKLSIRGVVRLAVELFDLLYHHPDYDAATLLDELRSQMR